MLDTTRLRTEVGFHPRFSTVEAFDDFAATLRPALAPATVRRVEVRIAGALGAPAMPDGLAADRANLRKSSVDVIDALPDPLRPPR